jgi:hypothetical protein
MQRFRIVQASTHSLFLIAQVNLHSPASVNSLLLAAGGRSCTAARSMSARVKSCESAVNLAILRVSAAAAAVEEYVGTGNIL